MPILSKMPSSDVQVEHRRIPRHRLGEGAPGRSQRVFDISRYGCQIESNDLSDGANGQFVEIDFGSHVTRAIIRWADMPGWAWNSRGRWVRCKSRLC
jgi:hypothetical protein